MLFGGVYVLWKDPLVLGCMGKEEVSRALSIRLPATVLYFPAWLWTAQALPALFRLRMKAHREGKVLHFMCNAAEEDRMLRGLGFPGALVSINCFINERVFRITGEAKQYDAVYTAQMLPFKRLHLAAKIPSLFVVTYGECRTPEGTYDLHRFEPLLSHASFNKGWASCDQIVSIHNQSRVGLALSAREGAMLGAVEYMLCGVPLVSTRCRGGRELFFDGRFVCVVEPTPEGVAKGVRGMVSRRVDSHLVREATLRRIGDHRAVLCAHVSRIIERRQGSGPRTQVLYERMFGGERGTTACYLPFGELERGGMA